MSAASAEAGLRQLLDSLISTADHALSAGRLDPVDAKFVVLGRQNLTAFGPQIGELLSGAFGDRDDAARDFMLTSLYSVIHAAFLIGRSGVVQDSAGRVVSAEKAAAMRAAKDRPKQERDAAIVAEVRKITAEHRKRPAIKLLLDMVHERLATPEVNRISESTLRRLLKESAILEE